MSWWLGWAVAVAIGELLFACLTARVRRRAAGRRSNSALLLGDGLAGRCRALARGVAPVAGPLPLGRGLQGILGGVERHDGPVVLILRNAQRIETHRHLP